MRCELATHHVACRYSNPELSPSGHLLETAHKAELAADLQRAILSRKGGLEESPLERAYRQLVRVCYSTQRQARHLSHAEKQSADGLMCTLLCCAVTHCLPQRLINSLRLNTLNCAALQVVVQQELTKAHNPACAIVSLQKLSAV